MSSISRVINNPIINITDDNGLEVFIQTIGDPHLGKTFRTGVPSSKLGFRENLVLKQFSDLLNPDENLKINYVVIMGDLFDKFVVSPTIVNKTSSIIQQAVSDNKNITYFIIPGNHDLSKDSTKTSSYGLLYEILSKTNLANLYTLYKESSIFEVSPHLYFYLDVYNPFHTELEEPLDDPFEEISPTAKVISFGHWDSIKNDFAQYLPNYHIKDRSSTIVSGHIHTPETFISEGTKYIYTGSIQPFTHGEDPNSEYYVTYKYNEIESFIDNKNVKKLEEISLKNLRINCYPGYVLTGPIDSLSIVYNNVLEIPKEISEDMEVIDISSAQITDFTTLYLHKLKNDYDIDSDLILKINNFLKDDSKDVSFTLD